MRACLRGHAGGGEIYRNLFFRTFFVSGEDSFGVCVFYPIRMILPEDLKPFWGNEKLNISITWQFFLAFFGVVNSVTYTYIKKVTLSHLVYACLKMLTPLFSNRFGLFSGSTS